MSGPEARGTLASSAGASAQHLFWLWLPHSHSSCVWVRPRAPAQVKCFCCGPWAVLHLKECLSDICRSYACTRTTFYRTAGDAACFCPRCGSRQLTANSRLWLCVPPGNFVHSNCACAWLCAVNCASSATAHTHAYRLMVRAVGMFFNIAEAFMCVGRPRILANAWFCRGSGLFCTCFCCSSCCRLFAFCQELICC